MNITDLPRDEIEAIRRGVCWNCVGNDSLRWWHIGCFYLCEDFKAAAEERATEKATK